MKKDGTSASGQILVELLIGVSVMAIIVVLIAQISALTFQATKISAQQSAMVALAQEGLEAVEALQAADWHNIYDLTKSSQEYYPKISAGAWTLTTAAGDKTVTLEGVAYQRSIIIDNVQRLSGDIVSSGGTDDPSTQKATVVILAGSAPTLTYSRYYSRSRNSAALQTDWIGGSGQATNPTSGFDANFNNKFDGYFFINILTAGQIQLTASGSGYSSFGSLVTSTFDTTNGSGTAPNSLLWEGTLPGTARVRFQFASSNCSNGATNSPTCNSGTWSYLGPDGTSATYYEPSAPSTAVSISLTDHNNKRYFKYTVTMFPTNDSLQTPNVTDIIFNWSS